MKICTEIDKIYLCGKCVPLNLPAGANGGWGKCNFKCSQREATCRMISDKSKKESGVIMKERR